MPPHLQTLLDDIRACRVCAEALPHDPRPVVRAQGTARLLIVGQAPGTRVHTSGIPWNDPSGDRLRDWLQMDRDTFYDDAQIALSPMGYCFPGLNDKGHDLPPRKECAPLWQHPLRNSLPDLRLTLLVGQYAQAFYLGKTRHKTLTETVRHWRDYTPAFFPLPHPSWRNTGWIKRNPWFTDDVLPALRTAIRACFARVA